MLQGSYVGITGPSSQQHHQHQLPPFLAWVGDWRLRAALSSPTQGEHLLLVLTQLAASCWVLAGRRRTASLLYADMALVLLRTQQGAPAAQQLLEAVCAAALEEGWWVVRAVPCSSWHASHSSWFQACHRSCIRVPLYHSVPGFMPVC
jgi:hypothetical protein